MHPVVKKISDGVISSFLFFFLSFFDRNRPLTLKARLSHVAYIVLRAQITQLAAI